MLKYSKLATIITTGHPVSKSKISQPKLFLFYGMFFAVVLCFGGVAGVQAAIQFDENGKWETTFDCPDWYQPNSIFCDGLSLGTMSLPFEDENYVSRIISEANNPDGGGKKGARFWKDSGADNECSGRLMAMFPSPQKELWIRWYERYESGFSWAGQTSASINVKSLYFRDGGSYNPYLGFDYHDGFRIVNQTAWHGPEYELRISTGAGWATVYPTPHPTDPTRSNISDGSWYCFEVYMKMNTSTNYGKAKVWVNGNFVGSSDTVDFSAGNEIVEEGWTGFAFLSNQKDPQLDRIYYVDFDDLVIYNSTPPNVDEYGNPFIGPIGWGVVSELLGDLNSDGTVNIFDYNIFLQNFGATDCGNVADLNGDCKVNIFDYNILLENFGRTQ